jgi:hypothetical protein
LTKTQEKGISGTLASQAVGYKRDIVPSHDKRYFEQLKNDKKVDSKEEYDTYLHGMDEVIDSTEKQKMADEETLKNCLGNREK